MQELALVEHLTFFPLRHISDKLVVYQIATEERLILLINEDSNTDVEGFVTSQAYVVAATDSRRDIRAGRSRGHTYVVKGSYICRVKPDAGVIRSESQSSPVSCYNCDAVKDM